MGNSNLISSRNTKAKRQDMLAEASADDFNNCSGSDGQTLSNPASPQPMYLISASDLTDIVRTTVRDAIRDLHLNAPRDNPTTPSRLLTIKECCDHNQLRICRATLYSLIKAGKIHSVLIGRRRFVPSSEIQKFLNPS